jgi:hypothetical protein
MLTLQSAVLAGARRRERSDPMNRVVRWASTYGALLASSALQADAQGGRGVTATVTGGVLSLSNNLVAATWHVAGGRLGDGTWSDQTSRRPLPPLGSAFRITLASGVVVTADEMTLTGAPRVESLPTNGRSSRLADRFAGQQLVVSLSSPGIPGPVVWRAMLREGSAYIREELIIGPVTQDVSVASITLVSTHAPGAHVVGSVQGSPVVAANAFFGVEHPMSTCAVTDAEVSCGLARTVPIRRAHVVDVSAVAGLTDASQLRRSFLAYLERERVHPYRPFLHYNSWYDLGYFTPYTEHDAVNVITAFGHELVEQRGVVMSSFLFDDGWDSHKTLWKFNDGFPNGFAAVRTAAERFGAEPGVWMSPFGGYGEPRAERLSYGKQEGFETNERGFALSGPVYYQRFRDTCLDMIRRFGVNQFKFDGIGRATGVVAGSEFGSDFEAAIHLIRDELRATKPDIFINLTTGTWPSPFWLDYADSIWRGGEDHSFAGVGTKRQQWITYRDAETYRNVVQGGPLFPLSSLMLHGLIYAEHAENLDTDPGHDFTDEVRAYFGTGTELQEMYITPALLTPRNWDAIAQSAKWARTNADVLADTHWIGGDPARLEVYGHAAWTSRLGIVVLRNPSDKPSTYALDPARAFELPDGAATTYAARSPWPEDRAKPTLILTAGTPAIVTLAPFEVLTLEATRTTSPR